MKILVLNCGSSSLKYQLINMDAEEVMAKGNYERIGEEEAFLTHKVKSEKYVTKKAVTNHDEALKIILQELQNKEHGVIDSLNEINAVGHRIVHGGEIFDKSVIIDEKVINQIDECAVLAPLHNPAAILGIRACQREMPNVKMVATFDTAFHQTMPKDNYLYPIPYEYYTKHRIRKYGAHGTSHQYVSKKCAELMNESIEKLKIVTCHLGQGASLCAVKSGKSINTSMGLSPLGGIPMVTRSGDLDPSVVTHIMEKENLTPSQVNTILNKKSGISAVAKLAPDFREIEDTSYENEEAKVAITIFEKAVAEFIAKYAVDMEGIDAIVFTGGIGENQILVRERICNYLKFMEVEIDKDLNNIKGEEKEISTKQSRVKLYIIPTNEELMIAKDTMELVKSKK